MPTDSALASDAKALYSKICELRGIQDTTPRQRMPAILAAINAALAARASPAVEKAYRDGQRSVTAAEARARQAERERLRTTLDYRLNNHLIEMKEGYDDSIVGFNKAWDIISSAFDDPLSKNTMYQAGMREGIEMAAKAALTCEGSWQVKFKAGGTHARAIAAAIRVLLPAAKK